MVSIFSWRRLNHSTNIWCMLHQGIVSASGESDICLWLMGFSRTYWTCGVFPTFVVILERKRHRTEMVKRRQSWKKVWGRGAWTSSAEKETWFRTFFRLIMLLVFPEHDLLLVLTQKTVILKARICYPQHQSSVFNGVHPGVNVVPF